MRNIVVFLLVLVISLLATGSNTVHTVMQDQSGQGTSETGGQEKEEDQEKKDEDRGAGHSQQESGEEQNGQKGQDRDGKKDDPSLQDVRENLSSPDRPVRLNAAKQLVLQDEASFSRAVSQILVEGSDNEKNAVLTVLAGFFPDDRKKVSHLMTYFLLRVSKNSFADTADLQEALFYFPSEEILDEVKTLLLDGRMNGDLSTNKVLLRKSRLLLLLGENRDKLPVKKVCELLLNNSGELDKSLHPEIVATLQKLFYQYSLTTVGDWKTWWEEHRSLTKTEIYRRILKRLSEREFKMWRAHVPNLIRGSGKAREKLYADLLSTSDPRKVVFMLEFIRKNPPGEEKRDPIKDSLKRLLNEDQHPQVRQQVLVTIRELNITDLRGTVRAHIQDFRPVIRKSTVSALGVIGDSDSGALLLEKFREEQNPGVLEEIVKSLEKLQYSNAVEGFEWYLTEVEEASEVVVIEVISALGSFPTARSVNILKNHLQKTDPKSDRSMRFEIAYSFGQMGRVEAVKPLLKLTRDPHPDVRDSAVQALGNISFSPKANNEKSPDEELRRQAVDRLFELMDDNEEESNVRSRAAVSIGQIGTKKDIKRIRERFDEAETPVQNSLRKALRTMLLDRYKEQLLAEVRHLREGGYHEFVADLIETHLNQNEEDQKDRNLLKLRLAQSKMAAGDWSGAVSAVENLEKNLADRKLQILLIRFEAFIRMSSLQEAKKIAGTLEELLEEESENWWKFQVEKARLLIQRGRPEQAGEFIRRRMDNGNVPDGIKAQFEKLRERANQLKKKIAGALNQMVKSGKIPDDLAGSKSRQYFAVKKALRMLQEKFKQENPEGIATLSHFLGKTTGRVHNLESSSGETERKEAISDWKSWIEEKK